MRHLFTLVFALVCLGASSQAQPLTQASCNETGALRSETYTSRITSRDRQYTVYLPPCYAAGSAAYPVLLLLHGSNADDSQWARLGFIDALEAGIRAGSAPQMIVLMPYGGAEANQNRFDTTSYDRIALDFLAQMSIRYRGSGAQAIGGISRGGFWAYQIGLRHADDFVAVGGHSPYFDRAHVAPDHNPLHIAEALAREAYPRLWLDRGTADHAVTGVEQMRVILERVNAPHEYAVYPGGAHSEDSWAQHVGEYLDFYARAFSEPAAPVEPAAASAGVELWLPAVDFGEVMLSLDRTALAALLAGELDKRLVLSESARDRLAAHGVQLHADTEIVGDLRLFNALWLSTGKFTLLPFDDLRMRLRPLWLDDRPAVDQLAGYPLAFDSESPNYDGDKLTRITLSGTTALTRHTLTALDAMGLQQAASGIQSYVRLADFFHITNEAPIAPGCPQLNDAALAGYSSMCMKREHADLFGLLEVDVVDLSGNHIADFGYDSFIDTLDYFAAQGIQAVGGGIDQASARSPLILRQKGSSIAWLACNAIGPAYALANGDPESRLGRRPGAAFCNKAWLQEALPVLASQHDVVLLTLHFREFSGFEPNERHIQDYQAYAEWGADVVVGTAQHQPMSIDLYPTRRGETAFIHYGLGNLFFDQELWGQRRFFMDTLYVYDGQLLTVEIFPGIIDGRARPRLLAGEDRFNFLHFMLAQKSSF
ncbi:MAG: CapA family protein [Chloroflexi bacterium]|nr:CapA family protein [Chloroflexota bacterium]MCY4248386.1 CapA family protein [Chloroflexota bacterium]